AGTVCRPAADVCDVPETCDGTSNTCPSDGFLPTSTLCRPSAGPCDVPEYCTGSGAGCPPDGFQSTSMVCRPSAGPCDVPEYCTGSSADCPPDDSGSGCKPCATAADCNDNDACTTDACIGGVCVHTNTCLVPKAAPTEMCGNCIDDDGNGLTDFEDPACSGQAGTLTLEEGLLRRAGDATRLDLHTALAGLGVNPLADDVILQIRAENGTDVLCARIPAGSF